MKTPEQIAAELQLQAQIETARAHALAEKRKAAGDVHFVHEDEVYVPILQHVIIPGLGERTALEICVDEEAQRILVATGSGALKKIA